MKKLFFMLATYFTLIIAFDCSACLNFLKSSSTDVRNYEDPDTFLWHAISIFSLNNHPHTGTWFTYQVQEGRINMVHRESDITPLQRFEAVSQLVKSGASREKFKPYEPKFIVVIKKPDEKKDPQRED